MTTGENWLERTAWHLHPDEFDGLRDYSDRERGSLVAMELSPSIVADSVTGMPLWKLWLALRPHPNVLEAVGIEAGKCLVRYAALDWMAPRIRILRHADADAPRWNLGVDEDGTAVVRLATIGVALVRVYEVLSLCTPSDELGWFAAPFVKVDLEGEIRVGFAVPTTKPSVCDERELVLVIGRALGDLTIHPPPPQTALGGVLKRCAAVDAARRFGTLADLLEALVAVGGQRIPRLGLRPARTEWDRVEAALGYLAVNKPRMALRRLECLASPIANACRAEAERLELEQERLRLGAGPTPAEAQAAAVALEQQRRFREALAIYYVFGAQFEFAIARCHFAVGDFGHAVDYSQRVLRAEPDHLGARVIHADSLVRTGRYAAALTAAEAWLAAVPDDGRAYLVLAKSLRGLGRLDAARDAFERACVSGPQLFEAMMVRRELEREATAVRAEAGTAVAHTLELPAQVSDEVRDAVISGRIADAIELIREPAYDRDAALQLLLADLLAFDRRHHDALARYRAAAALGDDRRPAALLGEASTLLELQRAAEALAIFDRIGRERPDLAEAIEGRARALQDLGRIAEAEDAFSAYVAKTGRGSSLRVRGSRG